MTTERAMPNDIVADDYAGLAGKYLALAQQTDKMELRSTYLSLAAGYVQLAQFSEQMRMFVSPRSAR